MNKRESKLLSAMTAVLTALAVVTVSIAVPILCRPFYYVHITPLQMRLRVGLTEEQVRETYNEIMDYCLGLTENFQLSHLKWSVEGASHFTDVRNLFLLDIKVAAAALMGLILLWSVARCRHTSPAQIKGHGPMFWAAIGLALTFAIIGMLAVLDFDRFFTGFHTLFFPGENNWIFDSKTDPVIHMLPQVFFRNCAILIAAFIFFSCMVLILIDRRDRKRHNLR